MLKKICVMSAFLFLSVDANAAQLGYTTRDVDLRKGPSLSAPIIRRLKAGTEVEVIGPKRPNPGDWYFVIVKHGKQPGFVHKNYIKLAEDQRPDRRPPSMHRQLAMLAGILITGLGIVLMASVLAPDLLMTAM